MLIVGICEMYMQTTCRKFGTVAAQGIKNEKAASGTAFQLLKCVFVYRVPMGKRYPTEMPSTLLVSRPASRTTSSLTGVRPTL